ncbi:phosphoglycerate mutase [Chloropicon primus]|uniref:Phosphoglycerate mutase n=1 Tax=Chloropicon primus TaxID=1764295 RepID=A0A5B8MV07_9CHLO|nr:phosphoglycerate mutase [Chloropicon primus]|eukprot:QDZ24151.1 phosphoglycerate mutase [Chloropicon primus]
MAMAPKDSKARVVWVLIDGLGDLSINEYEGNTPLAEAFTPFLDLVARAGASGLMDPVEPGLACGSDTAHLSLFGYDPREYYRGRGAFESLGAGLSMKPGEIAFKCNFATMEEETGVVTARRCDRNFEREGPILCEYLDETVLPSFPKNRVRVKYATEHRCGLVVEGPGLCDRISSTDPLKDNLKLLVAEPLDETEEAAYTAKVVNEVSDTIRKMLGTHPVNQERESVGKNPANCVLLRGCGELLDVEPFESRHGFKACMVAPTKVIAGIGASLGIEVVSAPGATGDYHTNLTPKMDTIVDALSWGATGESGDQGEAGSRMGFLHVKAVDDASHDGNVDLKRDLIAAVDVMVGQLVKRLWEKERESNGALKYYICCTGDHSTPVEFLKDHSHEPVPFVSAKVSDILELSGEESLSKCVPTESVKLPYAITEEYRQKCLDSLVRRTPTRGDSVSSFSEVAAARGILGRFPGSQIIPFISALFE